MAQRPRQERGAGRWRLLGAIGLATGVMTVAIASDGLGAELRPRDLVGAIDPAGEYGAAAGGAGGEGAASTLVARWSTSSAPTSTSEGGGDGLPSLAVPASVPGAAEVTGGPARDGDAGGEGVPAAAEAAGDEPDDALLAPADAAAVATTLPITPAPVVPAPEPAASAATPPAVRAPVCAVEPLAASAGLDSFYTQVCWAAGIPVVSSAEVDGRALQAAAEIVVNMLAPRPDLRERLVSGRLRIGIIGQRQRAVDLPEYRDLPTNFPETDWDAARAYGATPRRPLLAVPEENLLCSAADTYPGQSVLTHELGHTVLDMAVALIDSTFKGRIASAYKAARGLPVYAETYALVNADEYWAEGVQDFFDASRAAFGPNGGGDGYDGPIASRDALRANDPVLYGLVASVFTETTWRPSCPS